MIGEVKRMEKPHIILISCDHLRADMMGCAGHPLILTPHMDYLARRGVRFPNAYSTTPMCNPARAMIMTGQEGATLGVTYNDHYEITERQTLPYVLREAGYQTRLVGKMHTFPERKHNGFESMLLCEEGRPLGATGQPRGYDDYEWWLTEQGYSGLAAAHGIATNEFAVTPWHLPDHLHPTEWIGLEACKAIKRRDWSRPQFMWISFTAPHPPLVPLMRDLYMYERDDMPEPAVGEWTVRQPLSHQCNMARFRGDAMTRKQIETAHRAYYALVTQADRQIGFILGTLREEGMLENTWFIFTSDHGDNLGDHKLWQKANLLRGAGNIPFIITPPTRNNALLDERLGTAWQPGVCSEALVGLQDILPTCMEIAGLPAPESIDGKGLLRIVREPSSRVRDVLFGEIGPGPMNSGVYGRSLMLHDGEWKYLWYDEDGFELLFDVRNDPNELRDLSGIYPDIADAWRNRLLDMLQRRGTDPAVCDGKLTARQPGSHLISDLQKARLSVDQTPRGLH